MKIGYWGFKGRSEVVKMAATFLGFKYEEVDYKDPNKWFGDDKINLGIPFANLPYLIDGDAKVSETAAICDYLVLKANRPELLGTTNEEKAHIRSIQNIASDIFGDVMKLKEPRDVSQQKIANLGKEGSVFDKVSNLSKYLGQKTYFTGKLSIADLNVVAYVFIADFIIRSAGGESLLQKFPNIGKLVQLITSDEKLKARMASPESKNKPLFPPGFFVFELKMPPQKNAEGSNANVNQVAPKSGTDSNKKQGSCCQLI